MSNMSFKRSLLKGLTWEMLGLLLLFLITGNIKHSLLYIGIRILMFVPHEYLWKQTRIFKKRIGKV